MANPDIARKMARLCGVRTAKHTVAVAIQTYAMNVGVCITATE
jgi:hypothetical protein